MKPILFAVALLGIALSAFAQDASLGVLEERVQKLRAEMDDIQFRQQKTDKAIESIQADLKELRRNAGSASTDDLKALEARIAAVDAARQKDKQAIIDQLAKELAGAGGGKPTVTATGKEHTVQKGETLSAIARAHGVSVAELKKVNNLTGDSLTVGQKLAIPQK